MPLGGPIRARCDETDRLLAADEPLAGLQVRCGGEIPGVIAIPALLALVRKVRRTGIPLARMIHALDEGQEIAAWASVRPEEQGTGVEVSGWRLAARNNAAPEPGTGDALDRQLAEAYLVLDSEQQILAVHVQALDLGAWSEALTHGKGRRWTDFVQLADGGDHGQPLHWRLLDNATFTAAGCSRRWRARLLPRASGGLELLVIPQGLDITPDAVSGDLATMPAEWNGLLGRDLAPALRQPINRIVANAETVRTRLLGPLADEYCAYAADIAEAGRHLMSLIEDLADLEAVEAPDFSPVLDSIDLADCARRAAGILSVRAQERGIVLALPPQGVPVAATGEFRRVLQVLLNLLSNAIRYAPESSTVTLAGGVDGGNAWLAVMDEGQGLTADQAQRVFEKFERLGRSGDGGSGLGLYIARRLARAMGGDLTVETAPGRGAAFILSLPADMGAISLKA